MTDQPGPLDGIRVLDLSRVLAGPFCTQMLADLGAEVIKVERPGVGDETRTWGPPYVEDAQGENTTESAYYLCANRNKRSVTVDFSQPAGVALVKRLLEHCDVLVENFKVGGLAKFGLAYEQLREEFPGLVYCSITGFGQTGPYAHRPGYDMMAQGMGGLISITGEPDRPPSKVPVAINDIMTGMYTAVAMLSAVRHRDLTGEGQHVDVGLLDVQVSWLANVASNYLVGGRIPRRLGTAHPNTVPYQVFPTGDGFIIVAANNDGQFERFCEAAGAPELLDDPDFATNALRVRNRDRLVPKVEAVTRTRGHRGVDGGAGSGGGALRAGEHDGPGVRRPAGRGPRHADPDAAPARGRGHPAGRLAHPALRDAGELPEGAAHPRTAHRRGPGGDAGPERERAGRLARGGRYLNARRHAPLSMRVGRLRSRSCDRSTSVDSRLRGNPR